jgi:hypothetical protein
MEDSASWLRDPQEIRKHLLEIARQAIPYATALKVAAQARETVGNIDILPKAMGSSTTLEDLVAALSDRATQEKLRIATTLDVESLALSARSEHQRLSASILNDTEDWKKDIPGRLIFNRFAALAQIKSGRLKNLYLRKAIDLKRDPFAEIREIFRAFRTTGS